MSSTGYFHRVTAATPTRMWVNNVTPEQARLGIEAGALGCTQNPSYAAKMFDVRPDHCTALVKKYAQESDDDTEILIRVQAELVGEIAREFMSLFEKSRGRHGHVTIQGDPFAENTPSILRQAEIAMKHGPNVMPKIPAVPAALESMAALAADGVAICCTEVFAVRQVVDVCETILEATDGKSVPVVQLAHIAGIYDEFLGNYVKENSIDISPDTLWHAGIAIAKKTYSIIRERRYPVQMLGGGARGPHHFTEMVGASASVTINWAGSADKIIADDPVVVQRFHMPTPPSVIDELLEKLPDFRRGYFAGAILPEEYETFGPVALFRNMFEKSWKEALARIAAIRNQ